MDMTFASILALSRLTMQKPRAAARHLLDQRLPMAGRWFLFGLVVAASALFTHIGFNLLPVTETAFMGTTMANPVQTAVFQAGFLLLTVFAIYAIGRWRGGRGNLPDTLLLVGWMQFVLLGFQAAQIVALILVPPLAEVLGIVGLLLSFWILSQFIAELHSFQSGWRVFFAIVGVIFVVAFALSLVLMTVFGPGG